MKDAKRFAGLGSCAQPRGQSPASAFTSTSRQIVSTGRRLTVNLIFMALIFCSRANEVRNGGFEQGMEFWRPMFQREKDRGSVAIDSEVFHGGKAAARLEYRGEKDWSFEPELRLKVKPGDIIEAECWIKAEGGSEATLAFSTWDESGRNLSWAAAAHGNEQGQDWRRVRSRMMAGPGVAEVQPRLLGQGPTRVWIDDFTATRKGNVLAGRGPAPREGGRLTNGCLVAVFEATNATVSVADLRSGHTWRQAPFSREFMIAQAGVREAAWQCRLIHGNSGLEIHATFRLEGELPELVCELEASGELTAALPFPHPFISQAGDFLVVPMNEGISYPVEDPGITPMRLIAYGGHGICMAFYGCTDGDRGQMAILETPDDAAIRIDRLAGRLAIVPEWEAQKGAFGYTRKLRYAFFERGGHVAMAKRYRAHAKAAGLFKTLEQKRRENPHVDRLIGAVNVWCWERDAVALVRELKAAGIDRILWSNRQSPENLKTLNELGVLTSRYDIYQDVMDPANFPKLRYVHGDWTTAAWPRDIIRKANGDWIRGWAVESKDGGMIPCGVICDRRALDYARERIPAELATHPYRCRFIDTTTAAPWHECYDPAHPMARTESRRWKMELLRYVSEECGLVMGCETGHDAAVPYLHYFEGMLSLGPYRVPDSGRRMQVIWTNVPEPVAKFQLGHNYRLPLWELVYHDCVVAQWYWGDYNNKLPALWDKRDLFNVLYGTPPMFMFDRKLWDQNRERFVQSYRNTAAQIRAVGYAEMTDHRFLSPDRAVQQTRFANGVAITVNFGDQPFTLPDGETVAARGFLVREKAL
ncbi:MAG TPA: glycoside hydrolase [Candidatus Paceibacterota bacterium]|nr:glycoside hydrolase [Candidatus Paceibacterota bacterium]